MKILKYKKLSKNRYKVTFDNSELILYEDVILKNNLLREKEISVNLLELIMEENKYYEVYNQSLNLISTKMRTDRELKNILLKKKYDESLIEDVIDRLKTEGYLNEERYIEAYINDKIHLTKYGPYKIKRGLTDLNLDEYLIEKYLSKIDSTLWQDRINTLINKKLKTLNNKSESYIKNKIKEDLFILGYDGDLIDVNISNIKTNDSESIEKEYEKAKAKYSKKYKDEKLKTQIKSYLYRKGYSIEDINKLLN